MAKKLVSLTWNLVKAGAPMLVPIFKEDGTLLAARGVILTKDQVETLRDYDNLYTLQRDLDLALNFQQQQEELRRQHIAASYKYRNPFERLVGLRDDLMDLIKAGFTAESIDEIMAMAARLQVVCREAPDTAIATIFIDLQEYYTAQHSIHVAIVADTIATALEWSQEERKTLIAAALTMNISLGLMQDELAKQTDPLTEQQLEIIKEHPQKSATILRDIGVTDEKWIEFVEKHHEANDGSGYPRGLTAEDIPMGASIILLADIYCSKVAGRYYRNPELPQKAAAAVFLTKDTKFKQTASEMIVKVLGLYPPGCQVRLANGEMGVVIKRGDKVDAPYVRTIMDAKGNRLGSTILRNAGNKMYAVKEIIVPNVVKWDPDYMALWGYKKS
jgi:HD-GYP domain-containing protein (c-di-GMP phosphodiesterase class II)